MSILRRIATFSVSAALLAAAAPALADIPMVVAIDHSTRLTVPGAAASVLVGNPAVADVTVVDSHTVFVQGKAYGQTDVVVLNELGDTLYAGDIVVAGPTTNRVSVYRGAGRRAELACAPGCHEVATAGGGSSGGGGGGGAPSGGAAPSANPLAAAANAASQIGSASAAVTP